MYMLIKFKIEHQIEIIFINNEPYFKVKDVCKILGFKNSTDAVKTHCDPKGVALAESITEGGKQMVKFINEQNLYALMFNVPKTFKTDTEEVKKVKEQAKEFQKWVFSTVLPTIRKTGKFDLVNSNLDHLKHLDENIQKQHSKLINQKNFQIGDVDAIKEYNRKNCKLHTGLTTQEVKKIGKKRGLKAKDTQSAKQVLRKIDPAKAGSMSLADDLCYKNQDRTIEEIAPITKLSIPLFQAIIDAGLEHGIKELKE